MERPYSQSASAPGRSFHYYTSHSPNAPNNALYSFHYCTSQSPNAHSTIYTSQTKMQSTIHNILPSTKHLSRPKCFSRPRFQSGITNLKKHALCDAPNTSWHCSVIASISVAVDKVHTVHCGVHCTVCNKALTNGESEVLTRQVPQPLLLVKSVGEPD